MDRIIPDIDWCRKISAELGVLTRCPFSTVDECPRYYQSVSLLSSAGHTAIPSDKDEMLLKKWKRSSLWPTIEEQATSVSGAPERRKTFSNFCPEVAYDRFGLFASELYPYHDEIDHDNGIKFGRQEKMPDGHWVFNWSHVSKVHYTDCPIYSPLKAKVAFPNNGESLLEKFFKKIRNNPLIATLIIISTIVVGIGTFTDALLKIQTGIKRFDRSSEPPPANNPEREPKINGVNPEQDDNKLVSDKTPAKSDNRQIPDAPIEEGNIFILEDLKKIETSIGNPISITKQPIVFKWKSGKASFSLYKDGKPIFEELSHTSPFELEPLNPDIYEIKTNLRGENLNLCFEVVKDQ